MKGKVKLYGYLAKQFGKEILVSVKSVSELFKAVEANIPGFRDAFSGDNSNRYYSIRRGDSFKTGIDIPEAELNLNFNNRVWHILPLAVGHGGVGTFIVGAVLTVVGVVFPPLSFLTTIGISMMLSGVSQMLAPTPEITDYGDRNTPAERPSYLFNGPTNKTEAGGAIPLVYGFDVFIGSTVTSASIAIGDIA